MERTVDVATGESVAFSYELAGLGSRFFAVFLDTSLQLTIAVLGLLAFAWLGSATGLARSAASSTSKFAGAVVVGLAAFAAFALFFGYFIAFEWLWRGRTPGKRVVGIRVVRDGGFPLDLTSAVVRNVVRILEFGAGFYALAAVVTLLSPTNRRLGDLAAGTLVVRDARFERPVRPARGDRNDALVRDLTPAERDLVLGYVARRPTLAPEVRGALATRVANAVRPKLAVPFDHLDDDDLLVHLAGTALSQ
jgi:uncharacterized RDD family membrane protein YckC